MSIAHGLRRAADRIERHGWWYGGDGIGPNGQNCAVKAITAELGELTSESAAAVNAVRSYLQFRTGRPVRALVQWNDNVARDSTEVISVLRETASMLELDAPVLVRSEDRALVPV